MTDIAVALVFCYVLVFFILKVLSAVLPEPKRLLIWLRCAPDDMTPYLKKYSGYALYIGGDDAELVCTYAKRYALLMWSGDIADAKKGGIFTKIVIISSKNEKNLQKNDEKFICVR